MNYLQKKRKALMMNRKFKGYLRTVSGNPVTVTDNLEIAKISVAGNAVQDGIPSPDNPVEVQGAGERTENGYKITVMYEAG